MQSNLNPLQAQNVREVIELSKFQVYSVDNSYFKRPNCFQLMFDGSKIEGLNNNNRITYNFLTESPEAKRGWLQKLRKYCFCCQKCAALYDYEPIKSAPDAQQQQIDSTASPARRFISLWVMEAKDISQITTNKQASTYCAVLLDNVKQARTTSKGGESVFWGEEFKFDDVSPCQSRLSIVLFGSNKNDTYLELGCVSIKMNDIQPSNRVEDWFTIIPFTKSNQPQEAMSTIRIACLLSVEQKLSPMLQSKFLNVNRKKGNSFM